jgi:hypothetical protein
VDFISINEIVAGLQDKLASCWQFYIVVVLGTLGWLYGKETSLNVRQACVMTLGLTCFFLVNIWMTLETLDRLGMALAERREWIQEGMFRTDAFATWLKDDSVQSRATLSWTVHLLIDVAVVRSIWLNVEPTKSKSPAADSDSDGDGNAKLKLAS